MDPFEELDSQEVTRLIVDEMLTLEMKISSQTHYLIIKVNLMMLLLNKIIIKNTNQIMEDEDHLKH